MVAKRVRSRKSSPSGNKRSYLIDSTFKRTKSSSGLTSDCVLAAQTTPIRCLALKELITPLAFTEVRDDIPGNTFLLSILGLNESYRWTIETLFMLKII